jgi:hypothetical protein
MGSVESPIDQDVQGEPKVVRGIWIGRERAAVTESVKDLGRAMRPRI